MRAFFINSEIYMAFLLNSEAQGVSGKMNILPKYHGTGPPEAWGPMQLHWLHRLKADLPGHRQTSAHTCANPLGHSNSNHQLLVAP